MKYQRSSHAARSTEDYTFSQLIPYIGNKRKLLDLIHRVVDATGLEPRSSVFLDAFAGSGVVSRYAKKQGFLVIANDWEPYAEAINGCYVACNEAPRFFRSRSYQDIIQELNALEPREGWITTHLCPGDDRNYDVKKDRMFYMRKNGMRIDAIRSRIEEWWNAGLLTLEQKWTLLAPLLYQASYVSNTSGLFKGFHHGWGGQTKTALYRIAGDLRLHPAVFHDNGRDNMCPRLDATELAQAMRSQCKRIDFAYIDPPYNQHPYGSNYHVLNTVTLWDSPELAPKISGRGDKSAIRLDWRKERRSAYNHKGAALREYRYLLDALNARWMATSYSTDGNIPLLELVKSTVAHGHTQVFVQAYKRYRVSSQRFSEKPMNIEFVLLTDMSRKAEMSADALCAQIMRAEDAVLAAHPETRDGQEEQYLLFGA